MTTEERVDVNNYFVRTAFICPQHEICHFIARINYSILIDLSNKPFAIEEYIFISVKHARFLWLQIINTHKETKISFRFNNIIYRQSLHKSLFIVNEFLLYFS